MWFKPSKKNVVLILIGLAGLTLFLVRSLPPVSADTDVTYQKLKLLAEVLETVQSKYVDQPDAEKLIYGAIKGMVASLDPHSSFLSPDEFKELQIETSGKFSGIGIEITVQDGVLTVVSPIEDTPAYKVGLKAGDKIIRVDGKLTKQMSLMDAVKTIRGPKGSPVVLTILRKGVKELKDYTIVRDVISIISVKSRMLTPGYGYLRVTTFQSQTSDDLKKMLDEMDTPEEPLKGLVLDLRNNPGGLLNEAVEIVAGALKDHHRAVVMGVKTFGKGSVQTIIPFADKSGLRLTTARYYTPSGTSIQAKGIIPDVVVEALPLPAETNDKKGMTEKDLSGHIESEDKAEAEEADKKYEEVAALLRRDNQLREALSLLKGWEIFSRTKAQAQAG
ncbi:MAG: S41 family peptidase [Deltaproteobacteria bacterium]|nr:S41 family peptidase [Deltaproteobacteria bacterium]